MAQAIPVRQRRNAAGENVTPLVPRLRAFKLSFSSLLWIPVALALVWISILVWKWPFTRSAVITALQKEVGQPLQVGPFQATFFPLGYIAEDIRSMDSKSGDASLAVRKLTIVASYLDLMFMRRNLTQVSIKGLRMVVPLVSSVPGETNRSNHSTPPRFSFIGEIKVEDSLFKFSSSESQAEPFKVAVKSAVFQNINRHSSSPFRAELATNEPSGVIHTAGQLGPWNWKDAGMTPLTGSFTFDHANLGTVGDIVGDLHAKGEFNGLLHRVSCQGRVEIPQFGPAHGSHTLPLSTAFRATVNGLNGDTVLDDVQSRLNRTVIRSQGEIKGDGNQAGKTARLHLSVEDGRVDDFLFLVTRNPQPSMTGVISLQADVDLPPGDPGFLQKLQLQGDFGMSGSRFTKASTQSPINRLSESAEGMSKKQEEQDTKIVLSDIKGHVSVQNGIAFLSHTSFVIPGADANIAGTFNLLDKAVHLQGTLRTTGTISDTTSGWKAGFLKLLTPFLKKHSVTVVPFQITGTAQHSHFGLDLARKKRF